MARSDPKSPRQITCIECGKTDMRVGQSVKYCLSCSEARSIARKEKWAEANRVRQQSYNRNAATIRRPKQKSALLAAGRQISDKETIGFGRPNPDHLWAVRFRVPFTYSASKNHIYGLGHHVHKRKESRQFEAVVAMAAQAAVRGFTLVQNKVWIGLHVEKPNHRGDGINVVDLVCDALKVGIGVDDRWFCIDFLDWSINKNDPSLFIQIAQDSDTDAQACSHCGRLLSYSEFNLKKSNKAGIDRACRECRSLALKIEKAAA